MAQPGETPRDAVAASSAAREKAAVLCAQAAEAVARAEALSRVSKELLTAAQRSPGAGGPFVAHAIYDLGPITATRGVTLCSLLATDEVELIPELLWTTVEAAYRCVECEQGALNV